MSFLYGKNVEIHPSHDMTDWTDSFVNLSGTDRFGSIRQCRRCGAEQAKTVAGTGTHEELTQLCEYAEVPWDGLDLKWQR